MKKSRRSIRRRKRIKRCIFILASMLLLAVAGLIAFSRLSGRYYLGTTINNVNCSLLKPEEAKEKLEEEFSDNEDIEFTVLKFEDGTYSQNVYTTSYNLFRADVSLQVFEEILEEQQSTFKMCFEVQDSLSKEKLRDYLLNISELSSSNIIEPQNAYLQMDDNQLLEIVSEVYGLKFSFDEIYEYVLSEIGNGNSKIDLTSFFTTTPEVLSTDEQLIQNKNEINSILGTEITFILSDESEIVLDKATIAGWIYDSDGYFYFDESGVDEFVSELAKIISEKNSTETFYATDIGKISISIDESLRVSLDKESETSRIKEYLQTGSSYVIEPIYNGSFVTDTDTYVELDITRQKVWMYVDGTCILETDCVTGCSSKGYSTPTGIYYLTYKTQNATLRGTNADGSTYASDVKYWMPFNGNIGFHDASWRTTFGGEIYKQNGSHGCVNLPEASAKILYENITSSIPIFVYES